MDAYLRKYLIIITVTSSIILSGCGINALQEEIKWGNDVCSGNGGLKKLRVFDIQLPNATCVNGATFKRVATFKKAFSSTIETK